MRVATNTLSQSTLPQLFQLQNRQQVLQQTISSGKKLVNASDAPADASMVSRLSTEQQAAVAYRRNADLAETYLKSGDTELELLGKYHDQAKGFVENYQSDPSATTQASTVESLDALLEQVASSLNSEVNDQYLFGADGLAAQPFTVTRDADGSITGFSYQGGDGDWKLPGSRATTVSAGTNGDTNAGLASWANQLVALRTAVASGDSSQVNAATAAADTAEDNLLVAQVELGGKMARVSALRDYEDTRYNLRQDGINQRTEANIAEAIVQFTKVNQAYEASLQATSLTMNLSLVDFL